MDTFGGVIIMMTSSNGNIFRVTSHLCGKFTGPRWISRTKASDAELWCSFDMRPNIRLSKQSWGWWFETPPQSLWRHRNDNDHITVAFLMVSSPNRRQAIIQTIDAPKTSDTYLRYQVMKSACIYIKGCHYLITCFNSGVVEMCRKFLRRLSHMCSYFSVCHS